MSTEFNLPTFKEQKLFDTLNNHKTKFLNLSNCQFKNKIDNETLQNLFKKNLNTLPFNYKFILLKNIISENLLNELILSYELKNISNKKEYKNIYELKKFVNYSLLRYKPLVEKYFKFQTWKIWKLENYIISNQYVIFYNIVNNDEIKKDKFKERIQDLFNFFDKSISNFTIRTERYKIERDNLSYIFFIFFQA